MRMNVLDPFEVFSSPMFRTAVTPNVERSAARFPALNIWEKNDELFVEAEVAGFTIDNIEITLDGDHLTLKGEREDVREVTNSEGCGCASDGKKVESEAAVREQETTPCTTTYYRREGRVSSFERVIMLPWEVNQEKIGATLANGILTVSLPKAEAIKPKRIAVQIKNH